MKSSGSVEKEAKKLKTDIEEIKRDAQRAIQEKEDERQKAITLDQMVSALTFDKKKMLAEQEDYQNTIKELEKTVEDYKFLLA